MLLTQQYYLAKVGNCSISEACFEFGRFRSEVSIGDQVRNSNALLVGTILNKTTRTLTLDTVNNLVSGSLYCSKSQSSESSGLLSLSHGSCRYPI
jgi:hypothetical protein